MNIDRSKLTEEECNVLDAIMEKACVKNEPAAKSVKTTPQPAEDVTKGLHPEVARELESLRKFRESVEEKELTAVAKKYQLLGKKPEELVPLFKSMKAAGGTSYDEMISILDANLAIVEKSGVFGEIGKRGDGPAASASSAVTKVQAIAKSMMDKDETLKYQEAMAKAWENHPELVREYEEER